MVSLEKFKTFASLGSGQSIVKAVTPPPDDLLQSLLNASVSTIRDMLGLKDAEDLPDHERIDNAVYLYCQWLTQSRDISERRLDFKLGDSISESQINFFRMNLHPALMRQITGMISKYRKSSRFIPAEESA